MFVVLFGLLKVMAINIMNDLNTGSLDENNDQARGLYDEYFYATITGATALLVFGNIVDNSQNQKGLMITT